MNMSEHPQRQQQQTASDIEGDVVQFVRLDTEIREARRQMKEVRAVVEDHRKRIIEYMVRTKTDKLVGINGGTQYLECVSKTLKRRGTAEQMLAAIRGAIEAGIGDPGAILEIIQNCGGTYTEYRLSRRTRRVSATAMAAAVAAAMDGNNAAAIAHREGDDGQQPPPRRRRPAKKRHREAAPEDGIADGADGNLEGIPPSESIVIVDR
jgi:hypothetical protein